MLWVRQGLRGVSDQAADWKQGVVADGGNAGRGGTETDLRTLRIARSGAVAGLRACDMWRPSG